MIKKLPVKIFILILILVSSSSSFFVSPVSAIDQTNTPATMMLGQTDFENGGGVNGADLSRGLYSPYGVTTANGKLLVADRNNNRVLIYNSLPVTNYAQPDLVLGQTDLYQIASNQGQSTPNAGSLYYPQDVATDGTRLIVADNFNHRILI